MTHETTKSDERNGTRWYVVGYFVQVGILAPFMIPVLVSTMWHKDLLSRAVVVIGSIAITAVSIRSFRNALGHWGVKWVGNVKPPRLTKGEQLTAKCNGMLIMGAILLFIGTRFDLIQQAPVLLLGFSTGLCMFLWGRDEARKVT